MLHRGRALVLAYHNILPDEEPAGGDASLHLPVQHFAEQLDVLTSTFDVVPLPSLLSGSIGDRPRVAITFDDAYRGAMIAGIAELAARGLPATVFVAPAFVGGRSFWWDAVSPAEGSGPDDFREHALRVLGGGDSAVRSWAGDIGLSDSAVRPHCCAADESELAAAAEIPGITFGSHTWSHPNLTTLAPDALRRELEAPLEWLRERFHNTIPWISYPYGLASPTVERAAAEAGYEAGLRVSGGWLPKRVENRFALPRFNVPAGMSRDGFSLRASGLVGA